MALDSTGENYIPGDKQRTDKGTTVHLHSGVAMERGAGLTIIPEPPTDGETYGRGSAGGVNLWVRLDLTSPPPPPLDSNYYILKNNQWVNASELTFLAAFKASDIKVDPPVMEKDNLQAVLEAIEAALSVGVEVEPEPEPEPQPPRPILPRRRR